MAFGANTITSGLVSGLTGNNNKAYILMHRPELNPTAQAADGRESTGLARAAHVLQTGAGYTNGRKLGTSGSALNALSVDSTLAAVANSADYIPVQVQYNPSSISFQGMGGEIRRESVGGAGENQFQQFDIPSETTMSMELIFDDTNNKDAFMADGEMPLLSDIASVGGLSQRIQQGVTALQGKKYSVQDSTELFVAAMVQSFTRMVGFAWNKMIFWGELVGVNVQYTMFNKTGAPIRAKVTLQIRQDQAVNGEEPYQTEETWEKAFNAMFKENKTTNPLNGNLLNLN